MCSATGTCPMVLGEATEADAILQNVPAPVAEAATAAVSDDGR